MNFSHFPKVVGPASAKGEKRGERGLEIKYRHFKWETAQLLIPTSNETKKTNQDDDGGRKIGQNRLRLATDADR